VLEPLPPPPEPRVGSLRELAETVDALIAIHSIPASMVYFYPADDGYRVTVHCQDVRAMCAALGIEPEWKYHPDGGSRRHVAVILEGIEFSGSEELS